MCAGASSCADRLYWKRIPLPDAPEPRLCAFRGKAAQSKDRPEAALDPGGRAGAPAMSLLRFVGIRLPHDRWGLLFVLLLLVVFVFVVIIIVVGIARWHRVHDGEGTVE